MKVQEMGLPKDLLHLLEKQNGTRVCPICTKDFGHKHDVAIPIFHCKYGCLNFCRFTLAILPILFDLTDLKIGRFI